MDRENTGKTKKGLNDECFFSSMVIDKQTHSYEVVTLETILNIAIAPELRVGLDYDTIIEFFNQLH